MIAGCRFLPAILVGMLLLAHAPGQDKTQPKLGNLEQTARAFVDLLAKGDFAKATADFDATMTKVMPPDELKKTWAKLVGEGGDFKKQLGSRTVTSGTYQIVFVTCEFARAKFDARVVFDKDAKITGLFFAPTKKPAPTGAEEIYEGKLKVGALEISLAFHLFKQKDGSYAGTLDSPAENVKGVVLDEVTIKDNAVRLELKASKMVFEGKRSKDGQELDGHLKQAGQSLPLLLKRVARATESRRPQLPKKPYPYDVVEVAYENKPAGIKLAGTLTLPKGPGPFPAALLISGSGPQDRDETILGHKPFLVLADYLTRRGVAVLRVDDRGVGGSTGKTNDATSVDFAADVLAGVGFLKGRKEINAAQIGLIGHSEGGIIAPLVASRSKDVAFIVLLAGTGLPGEDILYLQGAAILKVAGANAAQLARQKAMQQTMFAVLRAENDNVVAEKKIRAALAELTGKLDAEEKKKMAEAMPLLEGQIKMVLTPWFRHFLSYDPRPALRKVTCPVLALNGAKDVQVDAALNLQAIQAALKKGGNKDVAVREFANLNHLFQTCKTGAVSEYGNIEETLAPVVLEAVARWILERTTGK
jgi:uncharacterized protein